VGLEERISQQGAAAAVRAYPSLLRSGLYHPSETGINALGYKLLEQKRFADAAEVFALNARLYPASANAFDSLGEAYALAGKKDLAVQAYRKVLELAPNNASAAQALKRLLPQ
jgi:Flp pilus assembly protein TadD